MAARPRGLAHPFTAEKIDRCPDSASVFALYHWPDGIHDEAKCVFIGYAPDRGRNLQVMLRELLAGNSWGLEGFQIDYRSLPVGNREPSPT